MATTAETLRNFIDGEPVAHDGETEPVLNPATGEEIARAPRSSAEDVGRAVAAARRAFEGWSNTTPAERARALLAIADTVEEHGAEIARLEALNAGKPIEAVTNDEIPVMADNLRFFAGAARCLEGRAAGEYMEGYTSFTRREAVGVIGQVTPWNYPLMMAIWKFAPAIAAGNTVVLKPAETTPLSALLFAEICMQAELPPGVVNIVTGAGTTGSLVVNHPGVKKVAFTGSTEVGKLIQRNLAGSGKRLTLELGGKAANIVFEDAPLDQAVEGIVNGIYFNQGHVCCAGSRLLVQESILEPLMEKLKRRLSTLRLGDPLDKNTDIGAINSRAQLEKIQGLVASGLEEGAELYQPECRLPERGFWFPPTLFTNVSQSYRIAREEIFGPVLSVLTFRTPAEAVEKANNTPYGLSAGVWTDKGSRILWMAERLRAGVVWANTFNRFDPTSPFGGYKESGFGREGGIHGLAPYLELT
jgi:aldehyde dehydrogenase (NAD+)